MRPLAAALAALTLLTPCLALGQQETARTVPATSERSNGIPPPPRGRVPFTAAGEWVFTTLLGWIWAPRGPQYTHYPRGKEPQTYVYLKPNGWQWIVAPWVWGNWWPYEHRPYAGTKSEWAGASLAGWQRRNVQKPAEGANGGDSFDDDNPFGDDDRPFAFDQDDNSSRDGDMNGAMWFGSNF